MPDAARPLVLASSSPRRRELLEAAGFEFSVERPRIDERRRPGEAPAELAGRLALEKARDVAERTPGRSCVLASDTIVVLDGEVLGKPADERDAAAMLQRIAGRTHTVYTGYALLVTDSAREEVGVDASRVTLRPVSPEEARSYAAGGEPLDKAGAYAVQGEGGRFVRAIEGSRSNVIGLPLEKVLPLLHSLGVHPE